jgi:hypothetical protein
VLRAAALDGFKGKAISHRITPNPRVLEWLRAHEPDIAVDPVIIGELRYGILILAKERKRTILEAWFDAGVGRSVLLTLGRRHRPEMGGTACAPSPNWESHAAQG